MDWLNKTMTKLWPYIDQVCVLLLVNISKISALMIWLQTIVTENDN